ncbi:MAG: EH signature domain-containing protein [Magnetococcus sp. YQC-9]
MLSKPLTPQQLTLLHPVLLAAIANSRHPKWQLWKDRCDRFHLLSLDGPDRLAGRIYQGSLTFENFCQEAGFVGELATGGFVQRSLARLLIRLEGYADPKNGLKFEQLKALLHGLRDQQGRFLQILPGFKAQLAERLLTPFVDREPETNLKNLVRDFLVKNLGDPRTHPAAWQAVDSRARQVITVWLSGRPARVDDKLWMFVEEANKQIAGLEQDFYQIKGHASAVPPHLLVQAKNRLNAIIGVAQFFQLFEVINTCKTIESTLQRIAQRLVVEDPHLIDELFHRLGLLQTALRDVPGFIFRA